MCTEIVVLTLETGLALQSFLPEGLSAGLTLLYIYLSPSDFIPMSLFFILFKELYNKHHPLAGGIEPAGDSLVAPTPCWRCQVPLYNTNRVQEKQLLTREPHP
jgi:hypothetical protein